MGDSLEKARGGGRPDRSPARVTLRQIVMLASAVVAGAAGVVLLDIFGVIDDDAGERSRAERLPNEYLYLDDERVDAYLGQLHGGLSASEARSRIVSRTREAKLGGEVVGLGGSEQEQEALQQTVSPKAPDRYYRLESELQDQFRFGRRGKPGFTRIRANGGCARVADLHDLQEGEFVRIIGARLLAPTYLLALAKVAHAEQFLSAHQGRRGRRVSTDQLTLLARRGRRPLQRYVDGFGKDPRLPFRLRMTGDSGSVERTCEVFLPVRYSKLKDAPSLLTGFVTLTGKVVRRLTEGFPRYFDVETSVTYTRALRNAEEAVRDTLAVDDIVRPVVDASATVGFPGLVVLPLAIYK